MKKTISTLIALCALVFLESCGGFYSLIKANINQQKITFPNGATVADLPYLDVNVIPRLTKLQTVEFRNKRKGVLEYFVLYASFSHKALGGEIKIPLYYLNLETGAKKEYEAYKVINKFPILGNSRQTTFLKLKTVAIEKSYANSASEVLSELTSLDNSLAQSILSSSPAQSIVASLNLGTKLIDKFAKKAEYNTELSVDVVNLTNPLRYKVYLIVPTNKNNVIPDDDLDFIHNSHLTIETQDGTGDLIAKLSDTTRLDRVYPYLILSYNFSNYVLDTDLSLKGLENSFAIIDESKIAQLDDKLAKASRKLLLDTETLNELFSLQQQAYENALFARLTQLQKLRKACSRLRLTASGSEKENHHKAITSLYEEYRANFSDAPLHAQSALYLDHFKSNIEEVDDAVDRIFLNHMPVQGNVIKSIVAELQKYRAWDMSVADAAEIKKTLQILMNYDGLKTSLPWFASTEVAPKALFLKNEIEKRVNDSYFNQVVTDVNGSSCSNQGNTRTQSLRNLVAFWTACESCLSIAKPAILNFETRCTQQLTDERAALTTAITTVITDFNALVGEYSASIPHNAQDATLIQSLNDMIAGLTTRQSQVASLSTISAINSSRNELGAISANLVQYRKRVQDEINNFRKQQTAAESIRLAKDENLSDLKSLLERLRHVKAQGKDIGQTVTSVDFAKAEGLEGRTSVLLAQAESATSMYELADIKTKIEDLLDEFKPISDKYLKADL